MGYGYLVLESQSRGWYYSTQDYIERRNDQPITIEEKTSPDCFFYLIVMNI